MGERVGEWVGERVGEWVGERVGKWVGERVGVVMPGFKAEPVLNRFEP